MPVATGTTRDENVAWEWLASCWIGPLKPISEGEGRTLLRTTNQRMVVPTHPPWKVFRKFL